MIVLLSFLTDLLEEFVFLVRLFKFSELKIVHDYIPDTLPQGLGLLLLLILLSFLIGKVLIFETLDGVIIFFLHERTIYGRVLSREVQPDLLCAELESLENTHNRLHALAFLLLQC